MLYPLATIHPLQTDKQTIRQMNDYRYISTVD